jgi:hypothetical protein
VTTPSTVEEMLADAVEFLDRPVHDLVALLDGLSALGSLDAPTPGPELAALLGGGAVAARTVATPVPVVRRARVAVAGLAAAAVAALSVTGAAAVANELPGPLQRAVAQFSESYLPFSFPRPAGDHVGGSIDRTGRPSSGPAAEAPHGVDRVDRVDRVIATVEGRARRDAAAQDRQARDAAASKAEHGAGGTSGTDVADGSAADPMTTPDPVTNPPVGAPDAEPKPPKPPKPSRSDEPTTPGHDVGEPAPERPGQGDSHSGGRAGGQDAGQEQAAAGAAGAHGKPTSPPVRSAADNDG